MEHGRMNLTWQFLEKNCKEELAKGGYIAK